MNVTSIQLSELISKNSETIQKLWLDQVQKEIEKARSVDRKTLLDSLPKYLAEVAAALRTNIEGKDFAESLVTARDHGETRIPLSYNVREVAKEYTLIRESILAVVGSDTALDAEALSIFHRINDAGLINAVEQFLEKSVIADERLAKSEALLSESYFKSLVDSSPAMIWITDENSVCTYLSRQWYEFTGRTPEQDLGLGWLENIHPDDLPETARVYANAVSNRGTLQVDYRLRKKTGEYRWAVDLGYPRFDANGVFTGYIGTVTDIHDRLAAEKQLTEIQNRFSRSVAATDLGVWYCDLPFSVLNWNHEVKKHFFLPIEATVTIDVFYERIHPDDRDLTRTTIQNSIDNHAPYDMIYRTTHPNDPSRIKSIRAIGWTDYNSAGSPIRFDGITIDVTAQVKAQNELTEARITAENANSAKSAFLANMSHEIRSPLGAVMGFTDLALQPESTREEINNYLSVVKRNSNQVLRIIDDILDLAKVEANRVTLEIIEFSLPEFLSDFISIAGFKARENGISFRMITHTEIPTLIESDPTRLRQILTNAVGNAIKFTSKGEVILHVCYRGDVLEFGIEDTGSGIPEEQARHLFQAFVQADPSTTRKFGGTGLGLVLTKRLCQLMGGDYVLEHSEPGVGSKFAASVKIQMPGSDHLMAKGHNVVTPVRNEPQATPAEIFAKLKILFVDDSPDNQVLVRLLIERQGATLSIASDGREGVDMALAGDFDVILMDIQMPQMDGHEAARYLRAKGYSKPIIALTAHAMVEESERAKESGFTSFLSKPIRRDALIAAVRAAVEK